MVAPSIPRHFNPQSVLDIGCGSGVWAALWAAVNSKTHVLAIDITKPTVPNQPPNLEFVMANAEEIWPFEDKFDFIHIRMMTLCLRDWPALFDRCWQHLNPGGWIEIDDTEFPYQAENKATSSEDSACIKTSLLTFEAFLRLGIDVTASLRHVDRLRLQGFINAQRHNAQWPVNGKWPQDHGLSAIGEICCRNWTDLFPKVLPKTSVSLLGMTEKNAAALISNFVEEGTSDVEKRLYFPM